MTKGSLQFSSVTPMMSSSQLHPAELEIALPLAEQGKN
jgi:hypothetical protein